MLNETAKLEVWTKNFEDRFGHELDMTKLSPMEALLCERTTGEYKNIDTQITWLRNVGKYKQAAKWAELKRKLTG